jgi:hypothetical protein
MAIRGKYRRSRSTKVSRKSLRRRGRTCTTTTHKKVKYMKGGSYEKDVTTRMTDGIPTKPLNKFVVTVPGYGTMSGTSYKNLAEAIDRDGPDAFLK